jgi:hypothetical protein
VPTDVVYGADGAFRAEVTALGYPMLSGFSRVSASGRPGCEPFPPDPGAVAAATIADQPRS